MGNRGGVFLQKSVQHAVTGFLLNSRAVQEATMEIPGFQLRLFLLLSGRRRRRSVIGRCFGFSSALDFDVVVGARVSLRARVQILEDKCV